MATLRRFLGPSATPSSLAFFAGVDLDVGAGRAVRFDRGLTGLRAGVLLERIVSISSLKVELFIVDWEYLKNQ